MRPVPAAREQAHVLVSAGRLGLGGVLTHLRLLFLALRRADVRVTVFASGSAWPQTVLDELRQAGITFLLPPRALWRWPRLADLYSVATWRFRLPRTASSLYCIGAGRSHLYLHSLLAGRIPSIYHEIVAPGPPSSPSGKCLEGLDVSVANSAAVGETIAAQVPHKPLRVIPFLTPAVGRSGLRPERAEDQPLRVVYLGRLVSQKRPDRLAREWLEICAEAALGPARLDVYGHDPDGGMLAQMRETASRMQPGGRVAVHGPYTTDQLPEIFSWADVVVLPSLWEGLPLVLVEAMRGGIPIVACAAGGTAELGVDNPDAIVTSTEWADFVQGLKRMAAMIRAREIDPARLAAWAEKRYGPQTVGQLWTEALLRPEVFFPFQQTIRGDRTMAPA